MKHSKQNTHTSDTFIILIFFFLTVISMGCSHTFGSGVPAEQTRTVEPFERMVVSGNMLMDVEIGQDYHVAISGDDNLVGHVNVRVVNGTLKIQAPKLARQHHQLHVTVVTPNLNQISAAITENVTINMSGHTLDVIAVKLSGVGKLNINGLQASQINSRVSGAGKLFINGNASHLDFELSGIGRGNFDSLCLQTANVRVHGMGGVVVNADEQLDATVKGLGNISYYGDPSLYPVKKGGGKIAAVTDLSSPCHANASASSASEQI